LSAAEPGTVVCVEELLVCWQNRYEGVGKVKDAFPGATVTDERPRTGGKGRLPRGGDELPF